MVRGLIIAACLISMISTAQQEDYIRRGLIKSSLTISPSLMLNRKATNYYLSGFLEGYLDKRLSIRGETHYFVDGLEDDPYLNSGIRTFCGVLYHRNKNNFDGHIGFMPGISVLQIERDYNVKGEHPYHVVPSFSLNIGATYYVWKFCHFFVNATYIHSTARELYNINGRTDELMISAGLGFNINAIKAK